MKHRLLTLILGLTLLATGTFAATWDSTLQGDLGTLGLSAEAIYNGSLWDYSYTLTCTSIGSKQVHVFAVDNPLSVDYLNAANTAGFVNPAYSTTTTAEWRNVANGLVQGQTATFTFSSEFAPAVTPVFVMVVNGGTAAWGETLGMSDSRGGPAVPEPASVSLAALGLLGVTGFRRRFAGPLKSRGA